MRDDGGSAEGARRLLVRDDGGSTERARGYW